jgi:hypothetical protein
MTKRLIPVPPESANKLKEAKQTGLGYQFVSVRLKNGKHFEQAVVSEGHIIQVKGYKDVPFSAEDVESVTVTGKRWNFRRKRQDLPS